MVKSKILDKQNEFSKKEVTLMIIILPSDVDDDE